MITAAFSQSAEREFQQPCMRVDIGKPKGNMGQINVVRAGSQPCFAPRFVLLDLHNARSSEIVCSFDQMVVQKHRVGSKLESGSETFQVGDCDMRLIPVHREEFAHRRRQGIYRAGMLGSERDESVAMEGEWGSCNLSSASKRRSGSARRATRNPGCATDGQPGAQASADNLSNTVREFDRKQRQAENQTGRYSRQEGCHYPRVCCEPVEEASPPCHVPLQVLAATILFGAS